MKDVCLTPLHRQFVSDLLCNHCFATEPSGHCLRHILLPLASLSAVQQWHARRSTQHATIVDKEKLNVMRRGLVSQLIYSLRLMKLRTLPVCHACNRRSENSRRRQRALLPHYPPPQLTTAMSEGSIEESTLMSLSRRLSERQVTTQTTTIYSPGRAVRKRLTSGTPNSTHSANAPRPEATVSAETDAMTGVGEDCSERTESFGDSSAVSFMT
jgi:hypothetical protein